MSATSPRPSAVRPLDAQALARVRRRLLQAGESPWLHQEAARRMAERLTWIRRQPQQVLDWGGVPGSHLALLSQAYPQARVTHVADDGGPAFAGAAPTAAPSVPWWSPARWRQAPRLDVKQAGTVPAGQADLVWSNMALHGEPDPLACMAQWLRALKVDGFLMFTTWGPGTLTRLQDLYRQRGWPAPLAPLVDMHDLGDMLVEAGFADPVMDQETLTLTWADGARALAELRGIGSNVHPARHAGLRTPRWRDQLIQALQADATGDATPQTSRSGDPVSAAPREGAGVRLEFEIVYGHAFKPAPRVRVTGHTEVAVDDLVRMARQGRRP